MTRPRARELGLSFGIYPPGPFNAITDVAGVRVGHATVWHGTPPAPNVARTGVTAIWPGEGDPFTSHLAAGSDVLNGYGEIIGRTIIDENGLLETPILLTSSMQIGRVYDFTCQWYIERGEQAGGAGNIVMPVVGECDDSFLNDARGLYVQREHVFAALDGAAAGPVAEGCVGSGAGMALFGFKGGIGTASRILPAEAGGYRVGVILMTNFGRRPHLRVAGHAAGQLITDLLPEPGEGAAPERRAEGSCIGIVATDAPLTSHQLARLAKRCGFGLVRTGSTGGNSSGEIFLAFSTATRFPPTYGARSAQERTQQMEILNNSAIDPLFTATVEASEEAVINALFAAETTTGRNGNTLHAFPIERFMAQTGRSASNGV